MGKTRADGKALKYILMVKELYNDEFPKLISILKSKSENRFEKSQQLLREKMTEMSKAMHECHYAGVALREKYDFSLPE